MMQHQEIEKLLPWYLNGTLREEEQRLVSEHLRGCSECTRELAELTDVQTAVRDVAAEEPEPSPFMMTRALASIDEYEKQKAGARSWFAWWSPLHKFVRVALVAQLLLIAGMGVYLVASVGRQPYRTASSTSSSTRARIVVRFQPQAPEAKIRETVLGLGATIVSGPSALGLYTLELPSSREDTGQIERALRALRTKPELVEFSERAQ